MIKRTVTILLLAALTVAVFAACSQKKTDEEQLGQSGAETYADYIDTGKVLAAQIGDVYGAVASDIFKAAQVQEFALAPDMLEAVRQGKVDAAILDDAYVKQLEDSGLYPDLDYLPVPGEVFVNKASNVFHTEELRDRFNEWLETILEDGTFDEIYGRWIGVSLPEEKDIPRFELTGKNGTLRVCNTGSFPPFSYVDSGNRPVGFDEEMLCRFAEHLGMDIEYNMMAYDAIIPYVLSGKADMSGCSFTVTGERADGVIFGTPFTKAKTVLVIKKSGASAENAVGFAAWLKTGIERNLITDNRWKMIVSGLGVTMTIALLAQIFGTAFGIFICWLITRKSRFVRWLGNLYCGLIHGTPIVVLLMITYYIIFGGTSISNVLVAVAAFTMITGASVAVNLKGAIETVDPAEIEAARSIGFTAFKAFRAVTLPQAVRRALPGYANGFVELVKATAIVGYIAIQDLTRAGDIIRSRTYDAYFPLLFVALIYLIVTAVCVQIFKLIVKKYAINR